MTTRPLPGPEPGPAPRSAPPRVPFRGAVLAGGRSSRFGRDKATASVEGRAMILRVLDSLAGADALWVVGEPRGPDRDEARARLAALVRGSGARSAPDRFGSGSPLAGLVAALDAAQEERAALEAPLPWTAVAACDLPFLVPAYWSRLREAAAERPAAGAVVVRSDDGRLETLAALWSPRALEAARERLERGELAVHALVRDLAPTVLAARELRALAGERVLDDLDRPVDLDAPGRRS